MLNIKEIKEMLELMNEHDLAELEVEREGLKVRLRKKEAGPAGQVIVARPQAEFTQQISIEQERKTEAGKEVEIKSPMVGTFYRAPSPDSPPFVEEGDEIEPGKVICIIEAMKLMNEIKAEVKGKIKKISVNNADPVEFGQTLFIIEPSS
jgi:acetyl-CoA carboxylase biotin carboxyl carrier protein